MYQDYKGLLSGFHAHRVKYLIVGGFAVIFHAQPRFTRDLDLFIKADAGNARAIYAALAEFGVPLQDTRPEDFADRAYSCQRRSAGKASANPAAIRIVEKPPPATLTTGPNHAAVQPDSTAPS